MYWYFCTGLVINICRLGNQAPGSYRVSSKLVLEILPLDNGIWKSPFLKEGRGRWRWKRRRGGNEEGSVIEQNTAPLSPLYTDKQMKAFFCKHLQFWINRILTSEPVILFDPTFNSIYMMIVVSLVSGQQASDNYYSLSVITNGIKLFSWFHYHLRDSSASLPNF